MPGSVMRVSDYGRDFFELGIRKVHSDALKKRPKEYSRWLSETPAQDLYEKELEYSGLGIMAEKNIGTTFSTDRIFKGPSKEFYMQFWALGVIVESEALYWEKFGVFKDLAGELGGTNVDRFNLSAFSILNNAMTSGLTGTLASYFYDYRGEPLCLATHTRLDGGTWSNRSSTDAGLSYTALQQVKIDFTNTVNERGRFALLKEKLLITSPDQEPIGEVLLRTTKKPGSMDNDVSTVSGMLESFSSPFLSNPLWWFVMAEKSAVKIGLRTGKPADMKWGGDFRQDQRIGRSSNEHTVKVFSGRGLYGSKGTG